MPIKLLLVGKPRSGKGCFINHFIRCLYPVIIHDVVLAGSAASVRA